MEDKKVKDRAGTVRKATGEGFVSSLSRDIVRNILTDIGHGTRITHHVGTHLHQYQGVAVTADGSKLVTANRDRTACLWDIAGGQSLMLFRGHDDAIIGTITFTADEKHVVTAAHDGTIRMWDCATGGCVLILRGHEGPVSAVAISPDDRYIVSAGYDETVRIWSLPAGRCEHIAAAGMIIGKMLLTKDGKTLATDGSDGREPIVCLWSFPDAGSFFQVARGSYNEPFYDFTLTRDGKLVVAMGKALHVFDARTGTKEKVLSLGGYQPTSVTAGSDSRRLVAACYPRTILVVNRKTGVLERNFRGPEKEVTGMDITPDGKTLCTVSFPDRICQVWDVGTGRCIRTMGNPAPEITRLCVSYDGKWLAAVDEGNTAGIRDLTRGSRRVLARDVRTIAFLTLPNLIATGHKDGKVRLWDNRPGKAEPVKTLTAHRNEISCLVPFRGGACLATGAYEDTLKVWDVESGDCIQTYPVSGRIAALAIDEDAQQMAIGLHNQTRIDVYHLQSGKRFAVLEDYNEYAGFSPIIKDLRYLPGGQGLVSCDGDGRVILWNPDTFQVVRTIEEPESAVLSMVVQDTPPYKKLSSATGFFSTAIRSMAVQKDGRHVVTGNGAGGVKRWDLESGTWEVCYAGEGIAAQSVALSPDESTLFAAFSDGTVRIMDNESGAVRCAFRNVRKGFFWFTPPDEYAPGGWIWTDRKDLLHVVEEDKEGRVLGPVPSYDERRRAYIHTRNNAKMVLARLRGLDEYAGIAGSYLVALTKKEQAAARHTAPMLPKIDENSLTPEATTSRNEGASDKKEGHNV